MVPGLPHLWQFVELVSGFVAVDVDESALDVEHPGWQFNRLGPVFGSILVVSF